MSQFRIVGVACDAQTRWTDDGDPVHTYGAQSVGADCGEEFTLMGGATFADVVRGAEADGWTVQGAGRGRVYLCPNHSSATPA